MYKIQGPKFKILLFAFCLLIGIPTVSADQGSWSKVAEEIEKALNKAVDTYEKGQKSEAMEMLADACFGVFEGEKANMEIAARRFISIKKASELEKGFAALRKGIKEGVKPGDFKKQTSNLVDAVKAAAKELDRKGVVVSSEF